MLDDKGLEKAVQDLIMDICEVMYHKGYDVVPVGAVMRLVGVGNDKASQHDNEYLALDDNFQALLESKKTPPPTKTPNGVTLH